ncbi:Alpha/beta hydrolase family-domain-containing protein [Gymnopilus junonius]|uniref:Alpha/beta hydrolase family-domain-containing protein n=1 Tax=Gymnopilus junonius TaxID=109634 RepID=A0A9P5NQ87_GYMJU|nr:Alpha/beta hydrolase family-domain-containing protein [Gymnopilus junonius]
MQEYPTNDAAVSGAFSYKSYVFDPRPTFPFLSAVNRYWIPNSPHANDPDALTLVMAHGAGFHKEQWEATINDLQAVIDRGQEKAKIREIWAIDAPNHGDSAILNEDILKLGYEYSFPWEEYARSIHLFLSGLGTGVGVDFSGHNLVGIGHSMGTIALALSVGHYPKIRYASLIHCELMMVPEAAVKHATDVVVRGSEKRRDIWPSKEDAYRTLKARGTWKTWDDRVLRSFVEFGLRPLPTSEYPDGKGVTLKCTRHQETACYRNSTGSRRIYHSFDKFIKQVPTHLIYGAINDYLTAEIIDDVINHKTGGVQNLASLSSVSSAGHMVVQINPSELAEKIYAALVVSSKSMCFSHITPKL